MIRFIIRDTINNVNLATQDIKDSNLQHINAVFGTPDDALKTLLIAMRGMIKAFYSDTDNARIRNAIDSIEQDRQVKLQQLENDL